MKQITSVISKINPLSYVQNKYLYLCAALFSLPCVVEASEGGSLLKEGVAKVNGVLMTIAVLAALGGAIGGGIMIMKGKKETATVVLLGGAVTAGAFAIVSLIFDSFGAGDAVSTMNFDF